MRIVLIGPPGVGKGTQAKLLCRDLDVPHVSTGDILRSSVQQGTALGRSARGFMEQGQLVPDELMGKLIEQRLAERDADAGFVLDGFPRTVEQVAILDGVLGRLGKELDRVFSLDAPEAEIVRRLSGRRVCPKCGDLYHIESRPPRSAGVCDGCSSALVQRPDDDEAVIRQRLRVYEEQTLPVLGAYRERGLLREIDATGGPDQVSRRLSEGIEVR